MLKSLVLIAITSIMFIFSGCGIGPDAPSGLIVTSTSPITLSWTGVSGATSYNIYRGTSPSTETILASDITGTTYSDTSALSGTLYYYTVKAVGPDGVSGASNEVNASAGSSPGNGLVLSGSVSGNQVTLNWTNTGATSYNVYWSTIRTIHTTEMNKITNTTATNYNGPIPNTNANCYYVTAVENNSETLVSNCLAP